MAKQKRQGSSTRNQKAKKASGNTMSLGQQQKQKQKASTSVAQINPTLSAFQQDRDTSTSQEVLEVQDNSDDFVIVRNDEEEQTVIVCPYDADADQAEDTQTSRLGVSSNIVSGNMGQTPGKSNDTQEIVDEASSRMITSNVPLTRLAENENSLKRKFEDMNNEPSFVSDIFSKLDEIKKDQAQQSRALEDQQKAIERQGAIIAEIRASTVLFEHDDQDSPTDAEAEEDGKNIMRKLKTLSKKERETFEKIIDLLGSHKEKQEEQKQDLEAQAPSSEHSDLLESAAKQQEGEQKITNKRTQKKPYSVNSPSCGIGEKRLTRAETKKNGKKLKVFQDHDC